MIKIRIFIFSLLLSNWLSAQKSLPIYIDFCNYYWRTPVINDSAVFEVRYEHQISQLHVFMKTWKGAMNFKLFSKEGFLLLQGTYVNSLSTLRNYITVRTNGIERNQKIDIITFYRPLKDGEWRYYKDGIIEKVEKYSDGIIK